MSQTNDYTQDFIEFVTLNNFDLLTIEVNGENVRGVE